MAISDTITSMYDNVGNAYNVLTLAGADLTNVDKNLVNLTPTWKERLLYFMNNGTDEVWNNWSKVNGSGTSPSINNTVEAPMSIEYKGQTSQEGTPTPSSPQDIHTVSGDNSIEVVGKNLFKAHEGTTITSANVQFTRNDDGTITLNGTSNNNGFVEILYAFQSGTNQQSNVYMPLDSSSTYTASLKQIDGTTTTTDIRFITQYDSTGNQQTIYINNSQIISNSNGLYRAYIRIPNGSTFTNLVLGVQIEKGNQPTTYEEYQSQSYPINLPLKNYLNNSTMTAKSNCTITNQEITSNALSQYTLFEVNTNNIRLEKDTYYYVTFQAKLNSGTGTLNYGGVLYNGTANTNQWSITKPTISSEYQTFCWRIDTSVDDFVGNVMRFQLGANSSSAVISVKDIMVCKKQDAQYTPYGEYIELCKIGNYQDRIYKDSGKWYLKKEIGKVVLNGSENWQEGSNTGRYNLNIDNTVLGSSTNNPVLSDRFQQRFETTNYSIFLSGSTHTISIMYQDIPWGYANFKTWLSNNNTIVYYAMATPTYTEITDTNLINQLEALKSKNETTNISQVANDLPFELSATALEG